MQQMQGMWFQTLDGEDTLEKEMETHSSSCLENPMDRGAWRATVHESDMTEQLTLLLLLLLLLLDVTGQLKRVNKEQEVVIGR